jgi:ribose 5-phosphate isomerase A
MIIFVIVYILSYSRKNSQKFGEQYKKGIPIEVVPMAYVPIQNKIEETYGGTIKIRMALLKAVNIFII